VSYADSLKFWLGLTVIIASVTVEGTLTNLTYNFDPRHSAVMLYVDHVNLD